MKIVNAKDLAVKHRADKLVITASRRTDMPAFYIDELITGLKEGVFHPQPMMQTVYELRFKPDDIHSIGLWSQDYGKWISRRKEIEGYKFWYRFTVLPDDPVCKPAAPTVMQQLRQLQELVEADGPNAVLVCIDPLMKYRTNGNWQLNYSEEIIDTIVKRASELGIDKISISVIDYYKKIQTRAEKKGIQIRFFDKSDPVAQAEIIDMVKIIKEVAEKYNVALESCCEKYLVSSGLTEQGSCVNGLLLNKLFGPGASVCADTGQRKKNGCGCTFSVDIGRYIEHGRWSHQCRHGCIQCYARP
jgi:hypothetical protein